LSILSVLVVVFLALAPTAAIAGTSEELAQLPTVDSLNRTETTLSNGGKWTGLNWAAGPGQDTTTGWLPSVAFPSVYGAYWNPAKVDGRYGDAASLTMAAAPGVAERYVSVWLNMPGPSSAKSGYQLRWTVNTDTTKYTVKLSKWVSGTETVLASNAEVSIPIGTTLAIVDTGGTVSAWRSENGTTFTSFLSAADSTYNGGYAGLEASGTNSRSTNFEAGPLLGLSAASTPVLDNLERSEVPLATGKWTKTQWAGEIGGTWMSPYRGYGSGGGLAGAYWNQGTVGDSGGGASVAATVGTGPTPAGQYLGLWLEMPSPGSARSGYEARFTGTNGTATAYKVELSKWVSGTRTVLATKENFSLGVGTTMALTDSGSGLVLWTGTGTTLTPQLTATDSTYNSGNAGLEVNGGAGTMYNFRAGTLGSGPETTITLGPTGNVQPQNVVFAFSSSVAGSTFGCSLDGAAYATCTSPKSYPTITEGPHTFRVQATDGLGNTDPTPAERSFTVVVPPTVTTQAASSVKSTQATLNAQVDPRGSATTYQFEWGTTTSYGNVVPATAKSAGSGTTAVAVSEPIASLSPDTEYHFRISATNANGTSKGVDKTFITTNAPVVTTEAASEVSAHAAKLNAAVNPHGASTTYYFEYGPSTTYGTKVPATPKDAGSGRVVANVAENISGLTEGATYHYRIVAANEIGTRFGADKTFATPLLPTVNTEAAEAVNANEAIVNGTVDPNGEGTTYQFEYGTTTGYGSIAPQAPEEAETGSSPEPAEEALAFLQPTTTYHYRIVATSAAGRVVGPDRTLTTAVASVTPQREQEEREEERNFTGKLSGALPTDFVNLHWSGDTAREVEPNRMEIIRRSGASMLRLGVGYGGVNELLFERSTRKGIKILPGLGGGPLPPRDQWDEWAVEAEKVINRYGKGGSFWAEKGLTQAYAPEWWEIWNEENIEANGEFPGAGPKGGDVRPAEFGEFMEVAAAAVRNADPNAKVLLGGLLSTQTYAGNVGEEIHKTPAEFLEQMGHQTTYDAVGLHPYAFKVKYENGEEGGPTSSAGVEQLTDKIRANIKKTREALNGLSGTAGDNKQLWINEIGWPVENLKAWEDPITHFPVSPSIQRDLLRSTFNMIKAKAESWKIRSVFYYNTQDWTQQLNWAYRSGLQGPPEAPKFRPAWYAFLQQTGMPEWPKRPKNFQVNQTIKPKKLLARALINPYGLTTRYWVKWGQGASSSTYGNFTPAQSAGFEEGDVEKEISVTGLQPEQTYHYRIVAENENEEKEESADTQFTTPPSSSTSNTVERVLHGTNGYVWVEGWVKEGAITGSGPGLAGVHVHVKIFRNGVYQQFRDVVTDSQGHYDSGYIQVGKGALETRSDFPGGGEWDPSTSDVEPFTVKDGYLIKPKQSGLCFDIEGGWFADGVKLMQGSCHGEANQVFSLQPKGTGEYLEIIARHSGKCLDVSNASTADGIQIVQHGCNGGGNQAFREAWWGTTPYVSYVAQHSQKCLDVANGSLGWAPIQQWTCNGNDQQRFSLTPVESGPIPTETTMEVDQVLHGSPGLINVHGNLQAGPYSMANRVVHVEFDNAQAGGWGTVYDLPIAVNSSGFFEYRDYGIPAGYYNIRARFAGGGEFKESSSGEKNRTVKRGYQIASRSSGKCLSLSENKNVNGQRFLQWDCAPASNGNGQVFSFWEPQGSGWYQLRANGTNRCVDVVNVSGENGAQLQLYDCLGGGQTNQHWKREPIQGQAGWYGLMPRHTFRPDIPSYKCMDVLGNSTANGALVVQWDCHWGGNQQWDLRGVIDP